MKKWLAEQVISFLSAPMAEERDDWKRRAVINQEHIEYWQNVAAHYRKEWNRVKGATPPSAERACDDAWEKFIP